MFKHLQTYSLRLFFRNKEGVAFGILLPFVFGLIYLFAFQELVTTDQTFDPVPVAVVFEGTQDEITLAKESLSAVAQPADLKNDTLVVAEENTDAMMWYYETDKNSAIQLLENQTIDDVVYIDNANSQFQVSLTVGSHAANDMTSTIVYTALSNLSSITGTITGMYTNAAQSDNPPQAIEQVNQILESTEISQSFITDSNVEEGISGMSIFYYASLAYICIFFMSVGVSVVTENEANYSPSALLVTASPVPKSKRFGVTFLTSAISSLAIVYLLLLIYHFNDVPLGNDPWRLVALMTLGVLVGLLLGTATASLFKNKASVLIGISITIPLVLGALSGLMVVDLKYFIMEEMPILAKLNPVSLINDALYYLNSYPTYQQYNENMLILGLYAVLLLLITLRALRRTDYENL